MRVTRAWVRMFGGIVLAGLVGRRRRGLRTGPTDDSLYATVPDKLVTLEYPRHQQAHDDGRRGDGRVRLCLAGEVGSGRHVQRLRAGHHQARSSRSNWRRLI